MNPGPPVTVGGNPYSAATPNVNRIYVSTLGYGPLTRSATSTYIIKYTDVQCYAGWPATATAHPSNYS